MSAILPSNMPIFAIVFCWWEVSGVAPLTSHHQLSIANVCTSVWRWCWHVWWTFGDNESDTLWFLIILSFISECLDFLLKLRWNCFSHFLRLLIILSWRTACHKEVLRISLWKRTSKCVSRCKKGKELRGIPIQNQGESSKNLQGELLTNRQGRSLKETQFVSILFQSLEDTSVTVWEKLKSKWICVCHTEKMIWTNGQIQQNWKSGKLHNLNGQQWKICRISWQLAMELLHHWMQPFFSIRTI